MRVGELRKILDSVSDEVLVVTPERDHAYRPAVAEACKAVRESPKRLSEFHGPEYVEDGMTVIDVFVVG